MYQAGGGGGADNGGGCVSVGDRGYMGILCTIHSMLLL